MPPVDPTERCFLGLTVSSIALSSASVRHATTPPPRRQGVQLRELHHDPIAGQRREPAVRTVQTER